jgi:IS30 family transposase
MKNVNSKKKLLTLANRIEIEHQYRSNKSITEISKIIGKDKSTVSREIAGKPRNGISRYRAYVAHEAARKRIEKRGNTRILDKSIELREYLVEKMKLGWSPEQVSIRLPIDFEKDKTMRISYEAIYDFIYSQIYRKGNGNVKPDGIDLRSYLPRRHKRRSKKGFRKAQKLERQGLLLSIEVRPKIVDSRKRVGDWEDDTLVSRQSKARVKSTNERKTGLFFFAKTKDGSAKSCDKALIDKLSKIPSEYLITLTRDRGKENYDYQRVENELKLKCYYAHAYCSQERGSNENGNGLLRRFFPKKTDWSKVTEAKLATAEYLINNRPRKRLNGLTPVEAFFNETGVAIYS